jgi:hypothetical protein
MLNAQDDKPKDGVPHILALAFATAAFTTLGAKIVDWAVEELKTRYGSKKPEETKP